MIKSDFEKYNSDDWLKKEIEREKRVSVWDFDEGRKVRNEHADDCDVRNNALEHMERHNRRKSVEAQKIENKPQGSSIFFVLDVILLFILVGFHRRLAFFDDSIAMYFLIMMIVNPAIFVYMAIRKRMLPNWYYAIVFVIAVIMELMWIIANFRYLRIMF